MFRNMYHSRISLFLKTVETTIDSSDRPSLLCHMSFVAGSVLPKSRTSSKAIVESSSVGPMIEKVLAHSTCKHKVRINNARSYLLSSLLLHGLSLLVFRIVHIT